jgi:hypothetical protein
MNPLGALAEFGLGLIREGHVQGWCRLAASILASAFVSFFGTLGLSALAELQAGKPASVAIILALAHASIVMALMVLALWLKSPLTKGIPILYPGKIEAARLEQMAESGTVFNPNDKR